MQYDLNVIEGIKVKWTGFKNMSISEFQKSNSLACHQNKEQSIQGQSKHSKNTLLDEICEKVKISKNRKESWKVLF